MSSSIEKWGHHRKRVSLSFLPPPLSDHFGGTWDRFIYLFIYSNFKKLSCFGRNKTSLQGRRALQPQSERSARLIRAWRHGFDRNKTSH